MFSLIEPLKNIATIFTLENAIRKILKIDAMKIFPQNAFWDRILRYVRAPQWDRKEWFSITRKLYL